jgi:hypothetical protein
VPEVEANQLKEAVEHMMGDDYYEKRNQVEKIVIQDMEMVDKVKHYPTKLTYMDEYIEILSHALQEWRQTVQNNILYDQAYERVVQKEPQLLQSEPLSSENMTPEIWTKIMLEVISIHHESDEGTEK